jgi:hypothetical protein
MPSNSPTFPNYLPKYNKETKDRSLLSLSGLGKGTFGGSVTVGWRHKAAHSVDQPLDLNRRRPRGTLPIDKVGWI